MNRKRLLVLLAWLCQTIVCAAAPAQIDSDQFAADFATISAPPTRSIGSSGYDRTLDYIAGQVARLPGVELQTQTFAVMTPRTTTATLTTADGSKEQIYPVLPASVRLNTTPVEGIHGELIYCGDGSASQTPAGRVKGNIAVLEADHADQWKAVAGFGPAAIVLIGNEQVSHFTMRSLESAIPINVPRFYVPDGPLAKRIRGGKISEAVTLNVSADWVRTTARNLYAYIAPQNALAPSEATHGKTYSALTIVAPVDASGFVPDLTPAAGQALQPAAALAILRNLSRHPPRRPVLVCFTGADSINLLGTRQMLMAFSDPPSKWREEIASEIDPMVASVQIDLDRARAVAADPSQLRVVEDRGLIARVVKLVETDIALEQDELFRYRVLPDAQVTAAVKARLAELDRRQIELSEIKYAFQSKPGDLSRYGELPRQFVDRMIERLGGKPGTRGMLQQWSDRRADLTRRLELFDWLSTRVGRGKDPDARSNDDRLLELVLGIDLSDGGGQVGPIFTGKLFNQQSLASIQEYREWFDRQDTSAGPAAAGASAVDATGAAWFSALKGRINFEPFKLARSQSTFLTAPLALPSEMPAWWGIPSMTLATLEDQRPYRDTPLDKAARVKLSAILPQLDAVDQIFRHAADDPTFIGQPEFRRATNQFQGQVVSTASGRPIPDLPRPGFLATYNYLGADRHIPQVKSLLYAAGVRRNEVTDCDSEGTYFFEGLPRVPDMKQLLVKVFRTASGSGEITASTDLGQQGAGLPLIPNLDTQIDPLRSVVFDCREFTLVGLYDPRFLQSLGEIQLIDARRNAEPQRFNAVVFDQTVSGQLEPGSRVDLLFRYGRIGNRVVLLNMPDTQTAATRPAAGATGNGQSSETGKKSVGEGNGYTIDELNHISPLSLATARDFWRLNNVRIEEYRKAGVTSTLIDSLHTDSAKQIEAADKAFADSDTPTLLRSITGAWATEARVYDAVQKMANDVIYAAIFLLLLAVPFSFCMERLCVGATSIYKQIAWTFGVFGLMTAALWAFHPAFKISSSPLIIVLAFAIILMSALVISVVYSKFDVELKRIRSGRGSAEGASIASASVLASAVMLGIANMRRRKFRTALTATTVILITFAVLCFTSSSRYQGVLSLPTGIDSTYPGLLVRQRGFRPMSANVLAGLRTAYPGKQFVEMWWTLNAAEPKDQVDLVAGIGADTRVVPVAAVLGLSPGAAQVSAVGDLVPGYERLEKGERNVIYLPIPMATQLNVTVGQTVSLAGRTLAVAGLYDPAAVDQRATILSGEPMTPLRYVSGALDASGQKLTDSNADTLDLDAGATADEASSSYEHLPAAQIAIVPAAVSMSLENSSLRLVAVRTAGNDDKADVKDDSVKTIVADITQRFALATFAGYSDGVKLVSASSLASVGGGANVAIPLAIGGLIIFNTMMGSIAERKREIHIYTSLGLAPFHVGALFIAEAMTYGLIGSVFGYIIGQGVGTVLLKLGWLGNVTLNYSGSSAMMTLGLILLIVLISALVPARMASKVAAPSIERSWRVPDPVNNQIIALLPFTINRTAAEGVVGYLSEWLEAHQEGSIGKFSAGKFEAFASTSDDGKPTRGLQSIIWLTPFDLGVRQHMLLLIAPGEFAEIYEVRVVLERLSGDDGSWWRMNRTFLTELRKEFLQWRSLSPQRMREYVEESHRLFETAPEEVAATGTGEEVRLA